MHEKQVGDAAAIAFAFVEETLQEKETEKPPATKIMSEHEKRPFFPDYEMKQESVEQSPTQHAPKPKRKLFPTFRFSHTRKLILTIVIIVAIVFVASIFFSKKKQKQVIDQHLYQQTVPVAQRKYDE